MGFNDINKQQIYELPLYRNDIVWDNAVGETRNKVSISMIKGILLLKDGTVDETNEHLQSSLDFISC